MMRAMIAATMAAMLSLPGCKREEPTAPPLPPPRPNVEAADDGPELRSQYADDLEASLAQLEKAIDQLAVDAKSAAAATTQKLDVTLVEMQDLTAKAKAKTAELKTATGEKWEQTKAESQRLLSRLNSAYHMAKEQLGGDAAPDAPATP